MTSSETAALQTAVAGVIARRAGSGADATAIAAEVRRTYDDLARVLGPLISQLGVDALLARALHVTRRDHPSELSLEELSAEPLGQFSHWLEQQEPAIATEAAAAIFSTFAALLATLIGEPMTTRYLRKAWPEYFSDPRPEGPQA